MAGMKRTCNESSSTVESTTVRFVESCLVTVWEASGDERASRIQVPKLTFCNKHNGSWLKGLSSGSGSVENRGLSITLHTRVRAFPRPPLLLPEF